MADGVTLAAPAALYGNASVDLDLALDSPATAVAFAIAAGPADGPRTVVIEHPAPLERAGALGPSHDAQWFDRVHVVPRQVDLARVLNDQVIPIEVWNGYLARSLSLTAITIAGPVGIAVDEPSYPLAFPALASRIFTVRALASGPGRIDNVVTWVFTGISVLGSNLTLIGSRLFPWPFKADSGEEIVEELGYLTDLMQAYRGDEQRVQLRAIALRGLEFSVLLDDARDAQHANALLHGGQAGLFGVPMWMHANPLGATVQVEDTTIVVETSDVPWAPGDLVFLWRNPYSWEALTVESVASGIITATTGATLEWPPALTLVMPIRLGRLSPEERIAWHALRIGGARLAFSLEAVA